MSSHVLDTASGIPACGVRILLELLEEDDEVWTLQDTRSGQVRSGQVRSGQVQGQRLYILDKPLALLCKFFM